MILLRQRIVLRARQAPIAQVAQAQAASQAIVLLDTFALSVRYLPLPTPAPPELIHQRLIFTTPANVLRVNQVTSALQGLHL